LITILKHHIIRNRREKGILGEKRKGWVVAYEDERKQLEDLGVRLGPWDSRTVTFENCEFDDEAIKRLEKHWGTFYWGMYGD